MDRSTIERLASTLRGSPELRDALGCVEQVLTELDRVTTRRVRLIRAGAFAHMTAAECEGLAASEEVLQRSVQRAAGELRAALEQAGHVE